VPSVFIISASPVGRTIFIENGGEFKKNRAPCRWTGLERVDVAVVRVYFDACTLWPTAKVSFPTSAAIIYRIPFKPSRKVSGQHYTRLRSRSFRPRRKKIAFDACVFNRYEKYHLGKCEWFPRKFLAYFILYFYPYRLFVTSCRLLSLKCNSLQILKLYVFTTCRF